MLKPIAEIWRSVLTKLFLETRAQSGEPVTSTKQTSFNKVRLMNSLSRTTKNRKRRRKWS